METLVYQNELEKSHNIDITLNDFKKIKYVVSDRRIKNAVIKKLCKENNIDTEGIYCNPHYNYMEYSNDISVLHLNTTYKGRNYYFEYASGCFKAYMFATEIAHTFCVNKYNHYLIKDSENNVTTFAGWEYNNNIQLMLKTLKK